VELLESGGGGAGGYRTSFPGGTAVTASYFPGSSIPVTVGAGGASNPAGPAASSGSPSSFSSISSTGGGAGITTPTTCGTGTPGGSGGGLGRNRPGGSGNAPRGYSPPEGNSGGDSSHPVISRRWRWSDQEVLDKMHQDLEQEVQDQRIQLVVLQ
jgi:hypothetical protein